MVSHLVFDARGKQGNEPGMHVLIVGVSRYGALPKPGVAPTNHQQKYTLGLSQLTAAANSAFLVYRWLMQTRKRLIVPLVTCRLLIAPSEVELASHKKLNARKSDAELTSFLKAAAKWRDDASSHPDNVTLFYFAGHGLQRKRGDNVMILENFGDGVGSRLLNSVDTFSLMQGMAPSEDYPNIARKQFYFIDSCRMRPVDAYKYEDMACTAVWDTPELSKDDRIAPVFYTSLPGTSSFAIPGQQSLFSKALLRGLSGDASELFKGDWAVTIDSLNKGLQYHLAQIAKEHKTKQEFRVDGLGHQLVLRYLKSPPTVDVELVVAPPNSSTNAKVIVTDFKNEHSFGPPIEPNPMTARIPAGNYLLKVSFGGAASSKKIENLEPPQARWELS